MPNPQVLKVATVHCSKCGEGEKNISLIKGSQVFCCSDCNGSTLVKIESNDGKLSLSSHPYIPFDPDDISCINIPCKGCAEEFQIPIIFNDMLSNCPECDSTTHIETGFVDGQFSVKTS